MVTHDVSAFSCSKPALDNRPKTRAPSNQQKGFTAALVIHENHRVVGYYGFTPTSVMPSIRPRASRRTLHSIPSEDDPFLLFRSVADIAASVGSASK
jgi:hypothetical protein